MANTVSNIQMNNATVTKSRVKAINYQEFSLKLNNYNDSIVKKAVLTFKGYTSSIINSILLFGNPGTGKTFFVKKFCKASKLKLIEMNLSTILDFRFGESIKKLEVFIEENKDEKQVIFFDEADSIFTKRGNVRDVFETSRIITKMLQLLDLPRKALIIFSTNLIDEIDKAIVRRFDIKINFNQNLNRELKTKILEDFLLEWNISLTLDEIRVMKMYIAKTNFNIADLKLIAKRIAIWKNLSKWSSDDFKNIIDDVNSEIMVSKASQNQ